MLFVCYQILLVRPDAGMLAFTNHGAFYTSPHVHTVHCGAQCMAPHAGSLFAGTANPTRSSTYPVAFSEKEAKKIIARYQASAGLAI